MRPETVAKEESLEYFTPERCAILELSNDGDDPEVSNRPGRMNARVWAVLPLALLLAACGKKVKVDFGSAPEGAIAQGVELVTTHCHTCHGVGELTMNEMLAPPLWGVRAHYLARYPESEAFVDATASFILAPDHEQSLMPLAVARYGLKAPVSLTETEIRAVAWAIYAGQVERPAWSRDYRKRHRGCGASW